MEMYDYVVTKPELNDDTLAHFLGGAHKYLKKYMGKNGKWVYVYKQKITDLKGRYRTRNGGRTYIDLDERENERGYSSSRARGDQIYGSRNAKNGWTSLSEVKGLSDHGNSQSYSKQGINRGIAAGRKRAAKQISAAKKGAIPVTKRSVKRFRNTNTSPFPKDWNDLRFKGYSNSMTNAGEKGLKVKSGIEAGRKRAAKKKKK